MARHPPVEAPYPSAFVKEQGGYAVIIQPPVMPLASPRAGCGVRRQGLPGRCTNIRAEIAAVIEACKVIRQILMQEPGEELVINSDGLNVIWMLRGKFQTHANLGEVRELLIPWVHVEESVRIQHARAHKGVRWRMRMLSLQQKQKTKCFKLLFVQMAHTHFWGGRTDQITDDL